MSKYNIISIKGTETQIAILSVSLFYSSFTSNLYGVDWVNLNIVDNGIKCERVEYLDKEIILHRVIYPQIFHMHDWIFYILNNYSIQNMEVALYEASRYTIYDPDGTYTLYFVKEIKDNAILFMEFNQPMTFLDYMKIKKHRIKELEGVWKIS